MLLLQKEGAQKPKVSGEGQHTLSYQENHYDATIVIDSLRNLLNTKLADYIFNLGSSKQASDFELMSQYIINHIPVVKQSIRVVKEWEEDDSVKADSVAVTPQLNTLILIHNTCFFNLKRFIFRNNFLQKVHQLIFFLVKGGCSSIYSPRIIIHEINLKFEQCKVPQLLYVMAHDEPHPTNSTQVWAIDGIYMRALTVRNELGDRHG
jgi:hypothetical protein